MSMRSLFIHQPACQFDLDSGHAKAPACPEPTRPYHRNQTRQITWLCAGHAAAFRAQGARLHDGAIEAACEHRMRNGSLCGAPAVRVRLIGAHVSVAGKLCSIHRVEMAASGFRVEATAGR